MTDMLRDPFVYTATGVLGDRRDTMLQNELILRVRTEFEL